MVRQKTKGKIGGRGSKVAAKPAARKPAELALLRKIPGVDEVLRRPALAELQSRFPRIFAVEATREALAGLRERIARKIVRAIDLDVLETEILAAAEKAAEPSLVPVINATGVILHTNLGRAPLPQQALEKLAREGCQYGNLEYDRGRGARGKRDVHTDRLLSRLLGSESSLVVNNNAAAVFLTLNTLAEGGEVLVSRGELIEIGGSFRIPDIMAKSGATLCEVGTTNRTRIADFERALSERARLLLRVHPSNFRVVGFTERPTLEELVALGRRKGLPVVEDLGSGCLRDLRPLGISDEPTVSETLRTGVDVVTFSGDKLLGGPQAGIIAGGRATLDRIRENPLFRALRVDKMTISILEFTLSAYLREDYSAIPIQRMIHTSLEEIEIRARRVARRLKRIPGLEVELVDGSSVIGGGSTPGRDLPSKLLALNHDHLSASGMAEHLRHQTPPVVARVENDQLLLDLRTVFEDQEDKIIGALARLPGKKNAK